MPQDVILKCAGLVTSPSPHAGSPEGGLEEASNILIRRKNVVEQRPGFYQYGIGTEGWYPWKELMYGADVILLCGNSYDSGVSEWKSLTPSEVEVGGSRMPNPPDYPYRRHGYTIARKNLYVTGDDGVYVVSSADGIDEWKLAGMPRAWQGVISTFQGGFNNWLAMGNTCSYQYCYVRKDANDYEVRGAPCSAIPVTPPTVGGNSSTAHQIPVHPRLRAGDLVEIYRTRPQVDAAVITPGAEYYLVAAHELTAADITARIFTFVDNSPDSALGVVLYTSPSQGGFTQENGEPPICSELATFNQMNFYACTQRPAIGTIDFGIVDNSTSAWMGIQGGFSLSGGMTGGTATIGTNTITGVTGLMGTETVGMWIDNSTGNARFPNNAYITNISGTTWTMSANAVSSGGMGIHQLRQTITVGGVMYYSSDTNTIATPGWYQFDAASSTLTDAQVLENFALIVNLGPLSTVYADFFYSVDPGTTRKNDQLDEFTASITFTNRDPTTADFRVWASGGITATTQAGIAASFKQDLSLAASLNPQPFVTKDDFPNEVAVSKLQEVEGVPPTNTFRVGRQDRRTMRMIPTRDSLWIFREDGVWRLSGTSPQALRVDEINTTFRLLNCECVDTLDEVVFAWGERGVVAVSDAGFIDISEPVIGKSLFSAQEVISRMTAPTNSYGANISAFLFCHPTDRLVIVGVPNAAAVRSFAATDVVPTEAVYVFSISESAWQTWDMQYVCGCFNDIRSGTEFGTWAPDDEVLVLRRERTLGDGEFPRYVDDQYLLSGVSINTGTGLVTFAYVAPFPAFDVAVGDAIVAMGGDGDLIGMSLITTVNSNTSVIVNNPLAIDDASERYLVRAIDTRIKWRMETAGAPALQKLFVEGSLIFQKLYFALNYFMGFNGNSEADTTDEFSVLVANQAEYNNSALNYPVRRCGIPRQFQRSTDLCVSFRIYQAACEFELEGLSLINNGASIRTGR